ncbi:MAG TPA: pilin [Ramlibacter sp.]|nr:pilin [Ramlibacter sp.]
MTRRMQHGQRGMTLVEMIVTVCIVAVLGSIAIKELREYTRRAAVTEVVLTLSKCRNTITENYLAFDSAPAAGTWGCEGAAGNTSRAGLIQTSSDGVVRIAIANLDGLVNGRHVYLVPMTADGTRPMITPTDLGKGVSRWLCGSDWQPVRNALPANCRADTTIFATQDFN